jgi:hypothetical protein
MRFSLSPSDTREVLQKGWGELHGLAGQVYQGEQALPATYLMVYSPRTEPELAVTKQILQAAIRYSSLRVNAPAGAPEPVFPGRIHRTAQDMHVFGSSPDGHSETAS